MSLAKGEGFSHCKGKEVAADDPPTETVGEETPYSEWDHFEEEGGRDLDSECPPLIGPWYATHIHFPVVLGEYSPPLPSRVWLSICHCDTEVS